MRNITNWSVRHKAASQIIIAVSHLVFITIAMQLAGWMQHLPIFITASFFLGVVAVATFLAFVAHAIKSLFRISMNLTSGYLLVRAKYGFVLLATYTMVLGWFYSNGHIVAYTQSALQGSYVTPVATTGTVTSANSQSVSSKGWFSKQKSRLSLKEFRHALREAKMMRKNGEDNTGQVLAIIGIIVLALALAYLVLALSCSLSCSGFGTGAIAVGVLGIGGIIWGTTAWIKHVNRVSRKKREEASKANTSSTNVLDSNSVAIELFA